MSTETLKSGDNSESLTHSTMKGVNVGLGSHGLEQTKAVGEAIKSIDEGSPVGTSRNPRNDHPFTIQRDGSPASGYAIDGTADFGEGRSSVTFEFGQDNPNSFAYFRPRSPAAGQY